MNTIDTTEALEMVETIERAIVSLNQVARQICGLSFEFDNLLAMSSLRRQDETFNCEVIPFRHHDESET